MKERALDVRTLLRTKRSERQLLEIQYLRIKFANMQICKFQAIRLGLKRGSLAGALKRGSV